jgi:hypothetical protein
MIKISFISHITIQFMINYNVIWCKIKRYYFNVNRIFIVYLISIIKHIKRKF